MEIYALVFLITVNFVILNLRLDKQAEFLEQQFKKK